MKFAISSFVIALVLAWGIMPALMRLAHHLKLVDLPDDNRKLHRSSIPLVGGIAVFIAVTVSIIVTGLVFKSQINLKPGDLSEFLGLFIASGFLLLVGILDDAIGLRGKQKLMGQIMAVSLLLIFGFNFDNVRVMGMSIEFGHFSIFLVFLWCLAVTNSINLMDGADGFAASIGITISLALSIMAMFHPSGRDMDAIAMLALTGALIGFLRFNFPPARVFLGDAGSMLIGFVLAAISIRCAFKLGTSYAFLAPFALLAIPFIDTAAALLRRKLTGRSIYAVDRGHIHHMMMKRGLSPVASLLWLAMLCSMAAIGGTISFFYRRAEFSLVSIFLVLVVMMIAGIFGVAEFQLLLKKSKSGLAILFGREKAGDGKKVRQSAVQLQGSEDWKDTWKQLCEFADGHELNEITFDLNLPWIHESFYATRRREDAAKGGQSEWRAEIPLTVSGKLLGRVEFFGDANSEVSHHDVITNLLKLVLDIESLIQEKSGFVPVDELNGHDVSGFGHDDSEFQSLPVKTDLDAN